MASSNRHWPSMFKSKPHPYQWQHDINSPLVPSASHRSSPFSSGWELERSPEPKPRWNPKPEQIRILEAIFNSGMVNPPREDIRRIRAQLQEYGQVGDTNIFYWFQNRKSRSKHKLRLLHNHSKHSLPQPQPQPQQQPPACSSFSSSSSISTKPRKSKNKNNTHLSLGGGQMMEMFPPEPAFLFPVTTIGVFEGICVSSQSGFLAGDMIEQQKPAPTLGPCTGLLLSDIMNGSISYGTHHQHLSEKEDEEMRIKMLQQRQPQICYTTTSHQTTSYSNDNDNNIMLRIPPITSTTTTITTSHSLATVSLTSDQLQVRGKEEEQEKREWRGHVRKECEARDFLKEDRKQMSGN